MSESDRAKTGELQCGRAHTCKGAEHLKFGLAWTQNDRSSNRACTTHIASQADMITS
jgi:hypothetical protein